MTRLILAVLLGLVACGAPAVQAAQSTVVATNPTADSSYPVAAATPTATPVALETPVPSSAPTQASLGAGYRIEIPRLGINLPIAEGSYQRDIVEGKTPEGFAFHLPGTSTPGQGSNTYLYAHARVGMFLSLWNARVGDQVVITTQDGKRLEYQVTEVHPKVPWQDTSWTKSTPDSRLTLQTSTGPNPTDPRFVVIAAPV